MTRSYWTNESVLKFAPKDDPVRVVTEKAREVVLRAIEEGWTGPPFDPFDLAQRMGVAVLATDDLEDARTVAVGPGRFRIEYNPNRPWGRLRFSLAHEIAHTLFSDCADYVRHRIARQVASHDEWQLELLCNVAAAEFLMPLGTFQDLADAPLDIDELLKLRTKYDVSMEALLLRVAKLTSHRASFFAASRVHGDALGSSFRLDYAVDSSSWESSLASGVRLPRETVASQCTAVGYTSRGAEKWHSVELEVQCVGAPPYPGQVFPRVLGFAQPTTADRKRARPRLQYVYGDATEPRGAAQRVIIHVVNDKTSNWGGQFARAVAERFPPAQASFRSWANEPGRLRLGNTHFVDVGPSLTVASMIAQKGYGASNRPRIRYLELSKCLETVACWCRERSSSVHMPRIGAGEAGGSWPVISELVENAFVRKRIEATVYTLPGSASFEDPQRRLPFNAKA